MTCPGSDSRTGPPSLSGFLSGLAHIVSGLSVECVRVPVRVPTRTHGGYVVTPCPGYGDRVFIKEVVGTPPLPGNDDGMKEPT